MRNESLIERGHMENPFSYSSFVTGPCFCNRAMEQKQLLEFIQASQNVLLYSHRRTGKSSLIKQVFQNINDQGLEIKVVYVDLYGTTSEKEFITRVFQQLGGLESNTDKLLGLLKNSIGKLSFQITLDQVTSLPAISPSFKGADEHLILKNLMDLLGKFSEKKKIVVAFDEFQETAAYGDSDSFEKQLRSHIQKHDRICYIFSGSQQHLLTAMFRSRERAFYQQAASFPLQEIETRHYVAWMDHLFQKGNLPMKKEDLACIVERFENHPMYVQLFCFFLWNDLQQSPWQTDTLERIERSMIQQKHLEYQMLWDHLTLNQKKTLKLVLVQGGEKLFSAEALMAGGIKTASMVTRCLKSLMDQELIIKNQKYRIQDICFKRWLESTL